MAGVRMVFLMSVLVACFISICSGHDRDPGLIEVQVCGDCRSLTGLGSLDCTAQGRCGWIPCLGIDIDGLTVPHMSQAVVSWCVLVGFEPTVVMTRFQVRPWNHFEGLSQRPIVR